MATTLRPSADLERDLLALARLHAEAFVKVERDGAADRDLIRLTDLERRHVACRRLYRAAAEREAAEGVTQ